MVVTVGGSEAIDACIRVLRQGEDDGELPPRSRRGVSLLFIWRRNVYRIKYIFHGRGELCSPANRVLVYYSFFKNIARGKYDL